MLIAIHLEFVVCDKHNDNDIASIIKRFARLARLRECVMHMVILARKSEIPAISADEHQLL